MATKTIKNGNGTSNVAELLRGMSVPIDESTAVAPKRKADSPELDVPAITIGRIRLKIVGTTPLIMNKFSEKATRQILDKQEGKAKQGRAAKKPAEDCFNALHIMPGCEAILHDEDAYDSDGQFVPEKVWIAGRFGFPAVGFKAAAVRAATDTGLKMTDTRRAFHINEELVEIIQPEGVHPYCRMDMVRVGMGVADVRFRPVFEDWSAIVVVRYNKGVTNPAKIANLFRTAGFGVGVGEWRPEKGGRNGMFGVDPEIVTLPDERI